MLTPALELNTGAMIPQLGLGTARLADEQIRPVVRQAIELGYRSIDTAARYGNERGVGQGIADSGVPRDELFVTTKLRGADQGYDTTIRALRDSLQRLGLEQVDLFLVHWPLPRVDRYVESWHAMERLRDDGLTHAIGVSNFLPEHLDRLQQESDTVPAVNQIECHLRLQQRAQREDDSVRGIVTESWSPLGQGGLFDDPVVQEIATRYRKSPAQVLIRWHLDNGLVVIPKASAPERLAQNLDVLDFALDGQDLELLSALDTGTRIDPAADPATWEEF
jgi:2,5-diketo-D-gluconate reductase A